jgi:hypothetical protein
MALSSPSHTNGEGVKSHGEHYKEIPMIVMADDDPYDGLIVREGVPLLKTSVVRFVEAGQEVLDYLNR